MITSITQNRNVYISPRKINTWREKSCTYKINIKLKEAEQTY